MNSPAAESTQSRALVMVVDVEVQTLNPKTTGPTNPARTTRIFNAGLTLIDPRDGVHPYMVEALPQLNTDTWRVASDGSMETVWRLRPGLLWHDGTPITAEDFAFAYRVYANSSLGIFGPAPQSLMTEVVGTDPRTLVIRWSITYPDADRLTDGSFGALPRHVLEPAFTAFERDPAARDAFLALPYWTTKYVGSGPYRLTSWERGVQLGGPPSPGIRSGSRRSSVWSCGSSPTKYWDGAESLGWPESGRMVER